MPESQPHFDPLFGDLPESPCCDRRHFPNRFSSRTADHPISQPDTPHVVWQLQLDRAERIENGEFRAEPDETARGIWERTGLAAGWLISRKPDGEMPNGASRQCLQLATGQWCPPSQATWFPAPGAAILYAADLGREIGRTVEVIFMQREPRQHFGNG